MSSETTYLPHSGLVDVAEIVHAIRCAPQALGMGDWLDLRVVAVPDSSRTNWGIYAAELRLESRSRDSVEERIVSAGPIRLFRFGTSLESIDSVDALWKFARQWRRRLLPDQQDVDPQQKQSIEWFGSGDRVGQAPGWRYSLYGLGEGAGTHEPAGPFFLREENFLATRLPEAVAFWLGRPFLRGMQGPAPFTWIVLNDRRAFFGEVSILPEELIVETVGFAPRDGLAIAAQFDTVDGETFQHVQKNPEERSNIPRPIGALNRLHLYLLSDAGDCLDQIYQDGFRSTRLERITGLDPAPTIDPTLQEALDHGESETVEFKSFLPLQRSDSKSRELLEIVCAFANSRGGHLFVGVNDRLEVVGLTERLCRELQTSAESAKSDYAKGVLRRIREGITPTPPVRIEWLSVAGLDVLRVAVEPQSEQYFALVESREIFVRRGANCTKALPSELEALFARRTRRNLPAR